MTETTHRNSLKSGYILHWYRIEKVLGQGSFGITYLAHDQNLDRMAAIKEYLPIELAVREGDSTVHPRTSEYGNQYNWGLDRFLNEARTLAKFEHPNIVRVLNVFEANHTAYMVMSYEEGESLQEMLSRRKIMEEDELLDILMPILGGLEKIHAMGFIHRDIKPANIFIRKNGSPVLLDFGSARQALGVQTKTLTKLVSPGYAPFEQYCSRSDAQGPWSDIYGLGATLYRSVTGGPPMDAMDRSRAFLIDNQETLVSALDAGRGFYSERFLKAIDHALRFREEDRPQTITEWRSEFAENEAMPVPSGRLRHASIEEQPTFLIAGEKAQLPTGKKDLSQTAGSSLQKKFQWPGKRSIATALAVLVLALGWLETPHIRDLINQRNREAQVQELLGKAQQDLEAARLVQPQDNNALQTYRKVLELDPRNTEAQQGLQAVTGRLVTLARQAITANNFAVAEQYLADAAGILPDAPDIIFARKELEKQKTSLERALAEARAREEKLKEMLSAAEVAAGRGDIQATLEHLDQARNLGAEENEIRLVKDHLRSSLKSQFDAATAEGKLALKAEDAARARAALKRAKDIKSRIDGLDSPVP